MTPKTKTKFSEMTDQKKQIIMGSVLKYFEISQQQ